jgi:hypothetical protein
MESIGIQTADNARRLSIEEAWTSEGSDRPACIRAASEFTTKDSGERVEFATGMRRDTTKGKPRFDLVSPADQPLNQTMTYRHAMLMARGAEKYGDRNWEKASTPEELDRFKQSAYRHFMQWYHGESDEDHAAAVYFNIAGAEYAKGRVEEVNDWALEQLRMQLGANS